LCCTSTARSLCAPADCVLRLVQVMKAADFIRLGGEQQVRAQLSL
jgi:hypothetical protein